MPHSAIDLYRAEKARHMAKLEPLFREIRIRLEIAPPVNSLAARNMARRKYPKRDQRSANADYYQRNKERLLARQKERKAERRQRANAEYLHRNRVKLAANKRAKRANAA